MEEVDVQKLPRKELLQLCTNNNIRTAGVKQDDLVRLLQKKLHSPATNPSRVMTKTRNQISTNSPTSSPRGKEKSAEKNLPTPRTTSQRQSLRPVVLVIQHDPSMKASPEPSPRKKQLSPNPGVLPRKSIATKPNSPPAQRSDLLRKKVNSLTTIGKLQAPERVRPAQRSDGRGRNNLAAVAPTSGIGKQAQERQPRGSDEASVRNRFGAPKKSIRSTSMEPVKRPGELTPEVKRNEVSRFKAQTTPKLNAAYLEAAAKRSPRASAGVTGAAAAVGSHSDLGQQDFDTVSDDGHHAMSEDSDDDDAHSVASEPASSFTTQPNRFHSPRTSTGSKLRRGVSPLSNRAKERDDPFDDSSVVSNAPEGKHSNPSVEQSGEDLISSFFLEDDPAFNLVGDAHELEINSFLNANIAIPEEINIAVEGSHQVEKLKQVRTPEFAPRDNLLMDVCESAPIEEISAGEVHLPAAEDETSVPQSIEVFHLVESPATFSDEQHRSKTEETVPETAQLATQKDILLSRKNSNSFEMEEGQVLTSKEKDEGGKLIDSTLNSHDEESPGGGVITPASIGVNVELVSDQRSATCSPLHQESLDDSSVPLLETSSGDDYSITSTTETVERVQFILDTAPLPNADMERSPITPMSVDRSHSSSTHDSTNDLDNAVEQDRVAKSRLPCDELQQDVEIKLRRDYNKDGSKKSTVLEDKGVKVPLLQHGREMENTHVIRRSFSSSILLWCSQLFSAIFRTRSQT